MEPEGSLPCSQQPATWPYSEPDQPTPRHSNNFISLVSVPILSSYTHRGLLSCPFHTCLPTKTTCKLPLTPTCYMSSPSHSSWNYHFLVILPSCTFMLGFSALKLAVVTKRSSSCQRYCTACCVHLCPKGSTERLQPAARQSECCYSARWDYKFITNIVGGDAISICPWRDSWQVITLHSEPKNAGSKADEELESVGQVHPNRMCHLVLGNTIDRHIVVSGLWASPICQPELCGSEAMWRAVAGAVRLKRWRGENGNTGRGLLESALRKR